MCPQSILCTVNLVHIWMHSAESLFYCFFLQSVIYMHVYTCIVAMHAAIPNACFMFTILLCPWMVLEYEQHLFVPKLHQMPLYIMYCGAARIIASYTILLFQVHFKFYKIIFSAWKFPSQKYIIHKVFLNCAIFF